jgi:hypothetical protein
MPEFIHLHLQAFNSSGAFSKKSLNINVLADLEAMSVPNTDPGVLICQGEPAGNDYMNIMVATPVAPASPFSAVRIYVDGVTRATFYGFAAQRGLTFLHMTRGYSYGNCGGLDAKGGRCK